MKNKTTNAYGEEATVIKIGNGYFVNAKAGEVYISNILDACLSAWHEDVFKDKQEFDSVNAKEIKYIANVNESLTSQNNNRNVYIIEILRN